MSAPTGIVVFGHGSSVSSANDAVRAVAADAARHGNWPLYETAFLEAAPRLEDAVAKLVTAGAADVLVLPYFLTLGIHLQRDLPKLVAELAARHSIHIRVMPPLDGHPELSRILVDRAAGSRS
ncbi:MAG: CbiX/SirB N-terminal domain-containing protein [Acidobacteriota bacterium]|nr:CbiX/SirB N-terminal domain-containing protein [Acidobacteriota bacterium]